MFFRTVQSKYTREMLCFCEVLVSVTIQLECCPTVWNTQRFNNVNNQLDATITIY